MYMCVTTISPKMQKFSITRENLLSADHNSPLGRHCLVSTHSLPPPHLTKDFLEWGADRRLFLWFLPLNTVSARCTQLSWGSQWMASFSC